MKWDLIKCDHCDCEMYCSHNSCIEDFEESEEYYTNQEIVEALE